MLLFQSTILKPLLLSEITHFMACNLQHPDIQCTRQIWNRFDSVSSQQERIFCPCLKRFNSSSIFSLPLWNHYQFWWISLGYSTPWRWFAQCNNLAHDVDSWAQFSSYGRALRRLYSLHWALGENKKPYFQDRVCPELPMVSLSKLFISRDTCLLFISDKSNVL